MSDPDHVGEALDRGVEDAFERAQVPLLARLVEQPSGSRERADVEAAARILDEAARSVGLEREAHPDPSGAQADHRVYSTPAAGVERALFLVGHVDTVFPRELGFFGFTRDGDVVRGPGTLDMKSGLTVALFALDAVRRCAPSAWAKLRARFLVTTDEELGSPTSRALIEALASRATRALVLEGGRDADEVVTRRRGVGNLRIEARGRAAHAGLQPEAGVSAIHALALAIPRLEALTDPSSGVTVNVGLVRGGTSRNTVPALASADVDVRFEREEDGRRVVDAVRAICAAPLSGRLADARVGLVHDLVRPPMAPSDGTAALVDDWSRHASAVGLGTGVARLQGGGSDGSFFAACGVPTIDGLGPFGKGFHRTDEWSSLESLKKKTRALARFLAST